MKKKARILRPGDRVKNLDGEIGVVLLTDGLDVLVRYEARPAGQRYVVRHYSQFAHA